MNLSNNNFSKTKLTTLFNTEYENRKIKINRYTYETRSKIYDVDILENSLFIGGCYIKVIYRINGLPYIEPDDIHSAIEEYFGLVI